MKFFFIQTLRDILLPQVIKHMTSSGGSKLSLSFTTRGEKAVFECSYDGTAKEFPTVPVLRESFDLFKERRLSKEAILEVSEGSTGRLTVCDFQRNSVKSGRKTETLPEKSEFSILLAIEITATEERELNELINGEDVRLYIGYLLSTERLLDRKFGILCTLKMFEDSPTTVSFICPEEQIDALLFTEKESKERVVLNSSGCSLVKLRERERNRVYVALFEGSELIHPRGVDGKYEEFWRSVAKESKMEFDKLSCFCPRVCADVLGANGSYFLKVCVNESEEWLNKAINIVKSIVSGNSFENENEKEDGKEDEKEIEEEEEKGEETKGGVINEESKYVESIAESIASIITMSQNTDFRMRALMMIHGKLVSDSELNEDQIKAAIINLLNSN